MQKAQIMFGILATIIPLQNIFLRFSHGPVEQLAPVCKYVVKLRFPLICFHRKVCGKFCEERMLCASSFSLWFLLIGFGLGPLFHLFRQFFNLRHIFLISSQKIWAQNAWASKRITNYWTTIKVHCLILSSNFSTAEVLLLMAWVLTAKTTFISKTVRPLMVRLSLVDRALKRIICRIHIGSSSLLLVDPTNRFWQFCICNLFYIGQLYM